MRKKIVAANWKMNGDLALLKDFAKHFSLLPESADVILALPSLYLYAASQLGIKCLCAQDVSSREKGAFTGEVSASMLADVGCKYSLVGHSERREYHHESIEDTEKKMGNLRKQNLLPILCVGEKAQEQRQRNSVLRQQLHPILSLNLLHEDWIIAYEPVWAIGSGQAADAHYAEETHAFIRGLIREKHGTIADYVRIIYGGSVTAENACDFIRQENIDGFLVGGASLSWDSFARIIKEVL